MAIFLAVNDLGAQVVAIAALAVNDLTEQALLDHVHDQHFCLAVAAVLQEHEGSFGLLVGADESPAIINGVGTTNLHGHGNAVLHCINSNGEVCFPSAEDQNCLDIVAAEEIAVIRGGKGAMILAVGSYNRINTGLQTIGIQITNGSDLDVVHGDEQCIKQAKASSAKADNRCFNFVFHVCFLSSPRGKTDM